MGAIVAGAGALFSSLSAGEVAAGAGLLSAGVGAAGALAGRRGVTMPPSPVIPQAAVNQGAQAADENSQQRASIAGGLQSTVGGPGATQAGFVMDPGNMQRNTLLGQ